MAFAHITTRIPDRKHDDLLSEVEGDGTPYFCFLDGEGRVIARIAGSKSVASFERTRQDLLRWREFAKKAAAGDKSAAIDAELYACLLGQQDFADLEEKLEPMGEPNPEQKRMLAGLYAEDVVAETMQVMRSASGDDGLRDSLAEDLVDLVGEGAIPVREDSRRFFWSTIARHADKAGKADLLERSIRELKALPELEGRRGEGMKRYVAQLEARYKELSKE